MTQLLPLRHYQRQMLDAFAEQWKEDVTRLAGILPTGGGKTVVFAHMAAEYLAANRGRQVIVLVHTEELVNQAYRKLLDVAPHLTAGIVKAERGDYLADVIVCSVQSMRSAARRDKIRHVGLIIVDECHHATAATYRAVLEHYGAFPSSCSSCAGTGAGDAYGKCWDCRGTGLYNGGETAVQVAGFTATLVRGDGAALGDIWQGVAFQRDISWMIRKRYLIPPRGKRIVVPDLNLRAVKATSADFREGDLGDALANSFAPEVVADAVLEHAKDRKTLAFFPTVESAYVFAEAFDRAGIPARVIHGALPIAERREILAWHSRGTVLVNCMVLTEGYDDPEVDCIVQGRPTKSAGLYVQIVGRGLRVDPGKAYDDQDCLILSVVDDSGMSLRSLADLSSRPVREPRDDETLIDLEDDLDAGEGVEADPEHYYAGPVEVREFDPLAQQSSKAWKRTAGGVPFLVAGKDAYVFLVEKPTGWSVVWAAQSNRINFYGCGPEAGVPVRACVHVQPIGSRLVVETNAERHAARRGGVTEHVDLPLDMAMAWAETFAVDLGADPFETLTKKRAPWRRGKPSPKAEAMALGLGIDPTGMKAGELSDAIDAVHGSRRIDPLAKRLALK